MAKKVMLVGIGGYIGGKFTEYIKKHYPDWRVDAVDSMNRKWADADFRGYDAVYNVSGLAHANARQGSEELYYQVNGQLPIDVATKAKEEGVPLFVQMSSQIVYGDMSGIGEEKMITAETVPSEPTVYGKSKMMAELREFYGSQVAEHKGLAGWEPPIKFKDEAEKDLKKDAESPEDEKSEEDSEDEGSDEESSSEESSEESSAEENAEEATKPEEPEGPSFGLQ